MKFSKAVERMKFTDTGDILKLLGQPDIISFAGGLPAEELFPREEIEVATKKALEANGDKALQYGPSMGYVPLRKSIADRMNRMVKTNYTEENVLVTCGSQQGLDLLCRVFCNEGDTVVIEKPSYLGAITAFNLTGVNYVEIPNDGEGMVMADLEAALTNHDVKMIYVVTDFQNPTGGTWSLERRKALVELATKFEVPVLEDNPYGELRFEGEYLPSLTAFDTKGLVCYLGTFSKTFAPGMRLGWIGASPAVLEKCDLLKQNMDLSTSPFSQHVCQAWLENFDYDGHINKVKEVYQSRRDAMFKAMNEHFPEGVKYRCPEGGLFIWCELPSYMKSREIFKVCVERKVAFVPGEAFFTSEGNTNYLRLNYSCNDEATIEVGIQRMAEVLKEHLQ